jgi:hypothetical protein
MLNNLPKVVPLLLSSQQGAPTLDEYITDTIAPMLYYKFDEASGDLINYGSETGDDDADGVVSGATQAQTGQLGAGEAYSFDGVDDIITVANANIPNVKALTTQRWAVLCNPAALGEGNLGSLLVYGTSGAVAHFLRLQSSSRLDAQISCQTSVAVATAAANEIADCIGAWCWLFMDYNDATKRARLWKGLSGTLSALSLVTDTAGVGDVRSQSTVLQLGNRSALDRTFDGLFDVAIVDSGLWTTDDMQALIDGAEV